MRSFRCCRYGTIRNEHGATAVEFALLVVPLMLIVFGIIGFGLVFGQQISLTNAARDAARTGVVTSLDASQTTCRDVVEKARDEAATIGMAADQVGVTVSRGGTTLCSVAAGATVPLSTTRPCFGSSPSGTNAQLSVRLDYRTTVPLVLMEPTFDLVGKGDFRCEYSL